MTKPVFGEEIGDIVSALNAVSEENIAKLDEYRFKNVFLPFFAENKNPYKIDLMMWATIAGGWQRPVDIVNNMGQVVARVPAICDGTAINPMYSGRDLPSVFHVILSSDMYRRISPADGERFLTEQLDRRAFIMQNVGADLDKLQQWDKLLTYYGYESIIPKALSEAIAEDRGEMKGETANDAADRPSEPEGESWEIL